MYFVLRETIAICAKTQPQAKNKIKSMTLYSFKAMHQSGGGRFVYST